MIHALPRGDRLGLLRQRLRFFAFTTSSTAAMNTMPKMTLITALPLLAPPAAKVIVLTP